jgi:hypothetical protein
MNKRNISNTKKKLNVFEAASKYKKVQAYERATIKMQAKLGVILKTVSLCAVL